MGVGSGQVRISVPLYVGAAANGKVATSTVYADSFKYGKSYTLPDADHGDGSAKFSSDSIYTHLSNLYKRIAAVETAANKGIKEAKNAASAANTAAQDAASKAEAAANKLVKHSHSIPDLALNTHITWPNDSSGTRHVFGYISVEKDKWAPNGIKRGFITDLKIQNFTGLTTGSAGS